MALADKWEELNELPGKALHGIAEQRLCFISQLRTGPRFSLLPLIPYHTSPPASSSGQGADSCLIRDTESIVSVLRQREYLGRATPHRMSQGQVPVLIYDIRVSLSTGCTGDPHTAC